MGDTYAALVAANEAWAGACRSLADRIRADVLPPLVRAMEAIAMALPTPTDGDAMLAQILAHPEDDTLRLVYADWLQEHDQPERAEFIRWQVGRDATTWATDSDPVRTMGRPWMRAELDAIPLSPPWEVAYRRGFIAQLACTADGWLARGDQIRERHPVTRVVLTTWPEIEFRGSVGGLDRNVCRIVRRTWRGFPEGNNETDRTTALLEAEWPGVTFELPQVEAP